METRKTKTVAVAVTALVVCCVIALAVVTSTIARASDDKSVFYGEVTVQFGDPDYDPTWPESVMLLSGSGGNYTAVYNGSDSQYYYPDTLSLYAERTDTSLTLTGNGVKFATYDAQANETLHDSITTTENGSDLFVLKIQSAGTVTITGGTSTITISFSAPMSNYPTSDDTPEALLGYLPIGQYASGSGWGSPYSDGTALTGTTAKVVGAYSGTGVSLGAAGGYVEYEMEVTNSDNTPYGVDFIVYGNAFVGNPEAASVKVYGTPVEGGEAGWYELAGSLYYADETLRNVDVTYKKVTERTDVFEDTGIYYRIDQGDTEIRDWTLFTSNLNWWPEESEGYLGEDGVWFIEDAETVDSNEAAALSDADSADESDAVVISSDKTEITYKDVTLVRDTDTTSDYAFGYADITPNGSNYGTAVNPYTYNTSGGNAYDISWAVDFNGEPVHLSTISKIRVYTSAALNVSSDTSPIFTVPGVFGETSAEVCGIYAVTGSGDGAADEKPVIIDDYENEFTFNNNGVTDLQNGTYSLFSDADYVFVNGVSVDASEGYELTLSEGDVYQIITQSGTEAACITVIK